jgi:two-component system OmpR family sensor kinase
LLKHEKKAFWKFFSTYFGSVALLILASGFFYFEEQKKSMIEKEHFSMIEYVRQVKMKQSPKETEHIQHKVMHIKIKDFNMNNFEIQDSKFLKYMPFSWDGGYILVTKDKIHYHEKLLSIKLYIIAIQVFLLALFGVLSYFLSTQALRPMQEAITKLDNFSKDLIHDINTPITSILLNMKLLDRNREYQDNKPLLRIKRSIEDISELHNNLTILLQEDRMIIQQESLFEIVQEVVATHERIYPHLSFQLQKIEFKADINKNAFKQVLINLISNACKYNKERGFLKIYLKDNILYIEDSGIGIKNPQEIFERAYKEHSSGSGIGLDIAKRLCEAMDIDIAVKSTLDVGTTISLGFKNCK